MSGTDLAHAIAFPDVSAGLRFLDDFTRHLSTRSSHAAGGHHFTPRFDLIEHEDTGTYELFGELPGFDRDNITVEANDDRSIQVSGWIPRKHTDAMMTEATPHDPFLPVQHHNAPTGPEHHQGMERFGEVLNPHHEALTSTSATASASAPVQATATGSDAAATTTTTGINPTTAESAPHPTAPPHEDSKVAASHKAHTARFGDVLDPHATFVHRPKSTKPKVKYLIAERQYGRFHREFNFPRPIKKEEVQARFDDGVLHISAPRAEVPPPMKIEIRDKKSGVEKGKADKAE